MSQQQLSQRKRPSTVTHLQKCASQYNNSQQMARAHIIANRWLSINELTTIEKGILRIIAEYCKGIEFRWDNYDPSTVIVDKEGLSLSIRSSFSGTQMISSNTGFSRGVHIFKMKLTSRGGRCSKDIGIATTKDVYGCYTSWRRNMKTSYRRSHVPLRTRTAPLQLVEGTLCGCTVRSTLLAIAHIYMQIEATAFYFSGNKGQLESIDITGKRNVHSKSNVGTVKWGLNKIVTVTLDCEKCAVKFEISIYVGKDISVDLGTLCIPKEKTWYPCIMCTLAKNQDFVIVE